MSFDLFLDIAKDAVLDSIKVFVFVFAFHMLLSFFEDRIAAILVSRRNKAPVFGALFGLIPQCGTSVLASDLYVRGLLSMGTLLAAFLSCSDEAVIIIMTSGKSLNMLPLLLGLKFVIGTVVGLAVNAFVRNAGSDNLDEGAVHYEGHAHSETKLVAHVLHPLHHSLGIFVYVLVINLVLGVIIGLAGEDTLVSFISSGKYFAPLLASIVGLVPNCASSVLLTELYLNGSLAFGSLLAGLLVNSGLGVLILFKKKSTVANAFVIVGISFAVSVVAGYVTSFAMGF